MTAGAMGTLFLRLCIKFSIQTWLGFHKQIYPEDIYMNRKFINLLLHNTKFSIFRYKFKKFTKYWEKVAIAVSLRGIFSLINMLWKFMVREPEPVAKFIFLNILIRTLDCGIYRYTVRSEFSYTTGWTVHRKMS